MPFDLGNQGEPSIGRPSATPSPFREAASAAAVDRRRRNRSKATLIKCAALAAGLALVGWGVFHVLRAQNDAEKAAADAAAVEKVRHTFRPFYKEPVRTPWTYAVVGPDGVEVSFMPDIGSHVIEKLPSGMKLIVNGDAGGWKHVVEDAPFGSHDGWITPGDAQNSQRLVKVEPPAPKTKKAPMKRAQPN
jgi:hypothetical protein